MTGTITTNLTLVNTTGGDAESLTNWTNTAAWSANPAVSNDVYLQGSNAINARASSATPGTIALYWTHLTTQTANLNLTASGHRIYFWIKCFSLPSMEQRVKGGIGISISSTAGVTKTGTDPWSGINDSKQWFVTGSDFEPLSGWVCYVIDPSSVADLSLGTPDMTSVDRIGIRAGAVQTVGGGSVKPNPVIWDALRYGSYIQVKDGTEGTPVTMQDLYAADSTTANQWGIVTKAAGTYLLAGKLYFGTTGQTAVTVFKDTGQSFVWQDFPVGTFFYDIIIQGAASFNTTFTLGAYSGGLVSGGCVIKGTGLDTQRLIAPAIVSGGTGYTAGDTLTVTGGTLSPGGLASQFKVITVSGGVITEARMERAGSYSSPPSGTLSVTGGTGSNATFTATARGGSVWSLTANAANQTTNIYGCTFSEMYGAWFTTTSTIRGTTFRNFGDVIAGGCTIDDCVFRDMRIAAPISAVYAVTVQTTAATVTNCTFVNCATALFWDVNSDTNTKIDGCKFISGGTGYAMELGPNCPSSITLTNVTFSGYGSDGTTNACIYNNSGKSVTITVSGGTTPTYKNGTSASTSVTGSVPVTVTVVDKNDSPIQNAQTAVYVGTTAVFNTDTNASGVATGAWTGTTPSNAIWKVRKSSTGATKYIANSGPAVIAAGTGMSVKVVLLEDPNVT